ncbi:MAG: type III-B CRISPR-associated protein Cas10/Cmr2 [Ignavibacteriaceae bacterium]
MIHNDYKSIFGFTIGPIYEMMSHAKKTREIWFSSFFFSWYVKLLCERLVLPGYKIIIPVMNDKLPISRGGFFPDHIIGYSTNSAQESKIELELILSKTTEHFAELINEGHF